MDSCLKFYDLDKQGGNMKKSIFLIWMTILLVLGSSLFVLATEMDAEETREEVNTVEEADKQVEETKATKAEEAPLEPTQEEEEETDLSEVDGASKQILGTMSRKDERIKELTQKYNDKTLGTVAYWLEVVRFYSTPVLFIFLVMGAFNFFIVGNKKLDKKEQGFGWMTTCFVGWVVFQVIPLVFALVTIGLSK